MRIAIIGPTTPYKGGIAQETTELAHRLQASGHQTTLLSWKVMYPKLLYPGDQFAPGGKPEGTAFPATKRVLSWKNPAGWWRHVHALKSYDRVIFVWWVPTIQGPVYLTMLKSLGKYGPKTTLICHNVLPHEPRPGDRALVRAVLRRVDCVVTHTDQLAALAREFTARPVITAPLPLALPGEGPRAKQGDRLTHQLLFFGIVRKYKGLDVLIRALAEVPSVKLLVAGEFWDIKAYQKLVKELGLQKRVTLQIGYVPNEALPQLFAGSDALVMPYRSGTGSQHVAIAHSYHLPVIATAVPAFAGQVDDGKDGLLCQPGDISSLAATITEFYRPGVAARLRAGLPQVSADQAWQTYLDACLGISGAKM